MTIDLGDHRSGESLVFSGRKRGRSVRDSTDLRDADVDLVDEIKIIVPDDTIIVTSSFILGMVGDIVRGMGMEEAKKKIKFEGPINESTVNEAIHEALRGDEPLINPDS